MNNFSPCYNNPEFIKNLAIKILDSKQFILFKPALRCGKTSFYTNLLNEIKNQIELREQNINL